MSEKIDNLDRRILRIVMHNARIPSKDVAVVCGVSRAAIHQRLQRLIDLNVITGSGYHVNRENHGLCHMHLHRRKPRTRRNVQRRSARAREDTRNRRMPLYHRSVYDAYQALCPRQRTPMELLNKKIQMIPGVTGTETPISLDQSIAREIPINLDPEED